MSNKTWAKNYLKEMAEQGYNAGSVSPFHRYMLPWLMRKYGITDTEKIVDIGSGQGHCLISLYEAGWKNLVAVDVDDLNFHFYKQGYGIDCNLLDINSELLPIDDGSIGTVINFFVIAHLRSPANLLQESYRVLRRGGVIFVVTPDWRKQYKTFWRDPTHLHPYDKESIARLLRMFDFKPEIYSWGSAYGLGRLQAYRWIPRFGMIGSSILAIGKKL